MISQIKRPNLASMDSNPQQTNNRLCSHILQIQKDESTTGNLFLGPIGALKPEIIQSYKIKAILTCMDKYMYDKKQVPLRVKELGVENHKWVQIQDQDQQDISAHFQQCYQFIDSSLHQGNVLVHCQAGISRSATIVISYVMRKLNLSLQLANKLVVSKRYVVSPNEGFWNCLKNHEIKLKKSKSQQSQQQKQKKDKKIEDPASKYATQAYPQKFANHIICLHNEGLLQKGNLFLGQYSILKSHFIKNLQLNSIISVIQQSYYKSMKIQSLIEGYGIKNHLWIDIKSGQKQDISSYFQKAFLFISEHIKDGNVLVYCRNGISYSTAIVVAYIIRQFKVGYEEALNFVQSKRKGAQPTEIFQLTLIQYSEKQIQP